MSETASLPTYVRRPVPSYTTHPAAHEQRLALAERAVNISHRGEFVKQSKSGGVTLRLAGQDREAALPGYGCGAIVDGMVCMTKSDNVSSVEIKIEGVLSLKEIAESGNVSHSLCLNREVLWDRERDEGRCPQTLNFNLPLPTTFSDGREDFPLPPTYEVTLTGVPGFHATISYSIKTIVTKVKTTLFGLGNTTVSTPFVFHPRTRPALPPPSPMLCIPGKHGFIDTPEWARFDGKMAARSPSNHDIATRLYLPRSRIFCLGQRIPFHVTFASSAISLAAFLPYGPLPSLLMPVKPATRIQVIRQSICDVRNEIIMGTKTDLWTTNVIGEGLFNRADDGSDWTSFNGQIEIYKQITVGGFKAGGLFVKDYVVLTMNPIDPLKAPFRDMRLVVPIRLTTDPWTHDGQGDRYESSAYSVPSEPEDYIEALPQLGRMI